MDSDTEFFYDKKIAASIEQFSICQFKWKAGTIDFAGFIS